MPEQSIPAIDPEYIAEVKQLAAEAESVLEVVARLTTRIGRAMEENDRLEAAVGYNDFAIDEIRAITGWDKLIETMYAMLATSGRQPTRQHRERRTPTGTRSSSSGAGRAGRRRWRDADEGGHHRPHLPGIHSTVHRRRRRPHHHQ